MNNLLNSGGMKGMLSTIWLVICAMSFGGAMQETGLLKRTLIEISVLVLISPVIFEVIFLIIVSRESMEYEISLLPLKYLTFLKLKSLNDELVVLFSTLSCTVPIMLSNWILSNS